MSFFSHVDRVYRYRLYPTRGQEAVLHETLWRLRELYNAALNIQGRGQRLRGGVVDGLAEDPRSPYLAVCGR